MWDPYPDRYTINENPLAALVTCSPHSGLKILKYSPIMHLNSKQIRLRAAASEINAHNLFTAIIIIPKQSY